MENRRKSNPSVLSVQQGSESGCISKVNGSILHNRDPVNTYHRKEKRRVCHHLKTCNVGKPKIENKFSATLE